MNQDAFKSVYNWQFVHAVDFWSLVLSASCDKDHVAQYGESPLNQLLYPLIQVALGAIRFVSPLLPSPAYSSSDPSSLFSDSSRHPATTPYDSTLSVLSSVSSNEQGPTSPSPRPSSKSWIPPT